MDEVDANDMNERANIVILADGDNVGVATREIAAGAAAFDLKGRRVTTLEPIPQGHKVALDPIATETPIVRFGMAVGLAKQPIAVGALVHVHNVRSRYLDNDEDHYE